MSGQEFNREDFESHIQKTAGHWYWNGKVDAKGTPVYGGRQRRNARRIMWELYMGEIPEDHQIKTTCEENLCINWEHLEPHRKTYPWRL